MTVKRCKAQAKIGFSFALIRIPNDLAMISQSQRGILFDCFVCPLTVLTISSDRIRRSKSVEGFSRLMPRLDPARFCEEKLFSRQKLIKKNLLLKQRKCLQHCKHLVTMYYVLFIMDLSWSKKVLETETKNIIKHPNPFSLRAFN